MDGHQRIRLSASRWIAFGALLAVLTPMALAGTLLSPTQGRPVFVKPGGTLKIQAQISDLTVSPTFHLVANTQPRYEYLLNVTGDTAQALRAGMPVTLQVPGGTPEQTYDLHIRAGMENLVGRHCVAVKTLGSTIRVVHLSDMNVGDVSAPDFDQRLIDEINLLNPDIIIATGDYLDLTNTNLLRGWKETVDFFSRLDAPAVLACGDHDNLKQYGTFIAPGPVFGVNLGSWRAVVLYDTPIRSAESDADQIRAVEDELRRRNAKQPTIIVSNNPRPSLLYYWRDQNALKVNIVDAGVKLWIAGGSVDWDGRQFDDVLAEVPSLRYIGTHESSASTRDGATGISHYRVIDLQADKINCLARTPKQLDSLPVGSLNLQMHTGNDGSQRQVTFTAMNHLPISVKEMAARVVLQNPEHHTPYCLGATIRQLVHVGEVTVCWVTFDLPDRSAAKIAVGAGDKPAVPSVDVLFEMPLKLTLIPSGGLATSTPVRITLTNRGAFTTATPLVRLGGRIVPYRIEGFEGPTSTAYALPLKSNQSATLVLATESVSVPKGMYQLQVYVKNPIAWFPESRTIEVADK